MAGLSLTSDENAYFKTIRSPSAYLSSLGINAVRSNIKPSLTESLYLEKRQSPILSITSIRKKSDNHFSNETPQSGTKSCEGTRYSAIKTHASIPRPNDPVDQGLKLIPHDEAETIIESKPKMVRYEWSEEFIRRLQCRTRKEYEKNRPIGSAKTNPRIVKQNHSVQCEYPDNCVDEWILIDNIRSLYGTQDYRIKSLKAKEKMKAVKSLYEKTLVPIAPEPLPHRIKSLSRSAGSRDSCIQLLQNKLIDDNVEYDKKLVIKKLMRFPSLT